ncbi:MAG: MXAN_2562 family outer membrane beta-barrel protein [Sandaracinaceae bacterium]
MSILAASVGVATVGVASIARADIDDWTEVPQYTSSPEHFGLELRVGIYTPTSLGSTFSSPQYFGGDVGPLLSAELHYYPFRIDYLGLVGIGGGFGWSQWDTEMPGGMAGDRNVFEILEPRAFLVWRIDPLDYYLDIPFVFTAKLGFDFLYWLTSSGGVTDGDGWALGPRFSGKASLVLDFLEPRAARQLDDEWGINHSEVFFEMYYSTAGDLFSSQLPVSGWGWVAGLGFTF